MSDVIFRTNLIESMIDHKRCFTILHGQNYSNINKLGTEQSPILGNTNALISELLEGFSN